MSEPTKTKTSILEEREREYGGFKRPWKGYKRCLTIRLNTSWKEHIHHTICFGGV
jgi:hypothetical protein